MPVWKFLFGALLLACSSKAEEDGNAVDSSQDDLARGAKLFVEDSKDPLDFEKIAAIIAANRDQLARKLEIEQAELYAKKKPQIEKALAEIRKMNSKPIRPEDRPYNFDNNTALGLDEFLVAGDELFDEKQLRQRFENVGSYGNRTKRQTMTRDYPNTIWTRGYVYYFFDPEFSQNGRNFVAKAISFYETNTCLRFFEVDPNSDEFTPIIRIYRGAGCFSVIGKSQFKKVQDLSLASWCERFDSSCHELGHALGFIHAQTRHDRDNWVWIDTQNIQEIHKGDYEKWEEVDNNNFGMRYDYRSIMHYKPGLWAQDPSRSVMIAYNSKYQQAIGASLVPVFTDIALLNKLYECNACGGGGIKCARGGYANPNDCTKCHCPSGFGGSDCSQRQPPSTGLNCGQTLTATAEWQTLKQNNVCGNGQLVTADTTNPSLCTYHIQAPEGQRITYWVNFVGFDGKSDALCYDQCWYGGLDLKGHDTNWQPEGYRLCCPAQLAEQLQTAADLLVVQAFNNFRYTDFQIMYKIDPCGAVLKATERFQWFTSNGVVGNGKREAADRNNPTTCTWTIEAPAGAKLLYAVNFVGFDGNRSALCHYDCWYGSVEVQGVERLRFCCPNQDNQLVRNDGNSLTVKVTNSFRFTEFKIQYAIDPCANSQTRCLHGGVPDPNSCGKCQCRPGFAGNECAEREPPSGGAWCGAALKATTDWQWFAQNNIIGSGNWIPGDPNNAARCTWFLEAPEGKKIEYEMNFVGFDGNDNGLCAPGCANGGVVVRGHNAFWHPEGENFCCHNDYNTKRTSGTSLLVMQVWNSLRYTDFQVAFRVV